MGIKSSNIEFFTKVLNLLEKARNEAFQSLAHQMVMTYFEMSKMIVEEEQGSNDRAKYGKELLKGLSKFLGQKLGKGYSPTNFAMLCNN